MKTRLEEVPGLTQRRRVQAWLWTGPAGHLLGGALDLLEALARYGLVRLRGRATDWARPRMR